MVLAVVGWVGAVMGVVVGMHSRQSLGVCRMSGDARSFLERKVNTLITPGRSTIQVLSSGLGRVRLVGLPGKALTRGRHKKAPVYCPCNRLATLRGATLNGRCVCLVSCVWCDCVCQLSLCLSSVTVCVV